MVASLKSNFFLRRWTDEAWGSRQGNGTLQLQRRRYRCSSGDGRKMAAEAETPNLYYPDCSVSSVPNVPWRGMYPTYSCTTASYFEAQYVHVVHRAAKSRSARRPLFSFTSSSPCQVFDVWRDGWRIVLPLPPFNAPSLLLDNLAWKKVLTAQCTLTVQEEGRRSK